LPWGKNLTNNLPREKPLAQKGSLSKKELGFKKPCQRVIRALNWEILANPRIKKN